ncbi:hypothetical protein BJEO58_00960 [Brevibacterium jeotgali]|uniref:Antitoxin SocA-like Panacea domain-containing protein n=2 Tax=Brevibacterium jeotgali TaxID=1262550 RepID=A0A2H1L3S1_9MICO|nr:hypothetical protein BJEO58_00960 [Brevibacterium jeotgali]
MSVRTMVLRPLPRISPATRDNGRMTSPPPDPSDQPAPLTTLTSDQVVAHARFSEPGIDKSSALMLLFFVTGWLEEWNGRRVVDAGFEAWQHGPTDPAAHARFAETLPKRLRLPDDQMLELQVESVVTWGLGGKPGQRKPVHSSALISAAKATRAYQEAAGTEKPAFASGPELPADRMTDAFHALAEAVAAGAADGPSQPGEEERAEADRQAEAKRLRAQLAERFDTGPGLTEV